MPPRWPRKPDRKDPAYRRLDDRMNFAIHVAVFAVSNSGLWFFQLLNQTREGAAIWPLTPWITSGWALLVFIHALYIFKIANYSYPDAELVTPPDSPSVKSSE